MINQPYLLFAKNKKKVRRHAIQEFTFLYDQKMVGLYFNKDGTNKGFGDGGMNTILKGAPELTPCNFEF